MCARKKSYFRMIPLVLLFVLLLATGCRAQDGSSKESSPALTFPSTGYFRYGHRIGSPPDAMAIGLIPMINDVTLPYKIELEPSVGETLKKVSRSMGEIDVAMLPVDVAAIANRNTAGRIQVIAVNSFDCHFCLTADEGISSVKDLAGRTVMTTEQGSITEYVLRHLLEQNGVTDCVLEFYSEAAEVMDLLSRDPAGIAILPQPFAAEAEARDEKLHTAFSLADEWDALGNGSRLVSGVTVVEKNVTSPGPEVVKSFLIDHAFSAAAVFEDLEHVAAKAVELGFFSTVEVAEQAIPSCGIVCLTGQEMKDTVSAFLEVLLEFAPELIGGRLPSESFYYIP